MKIYSMRDVILRDLMKGMRNTCNKIILNATGIGQYHDLNEIFKDLILSLSLLPFRLKRERQRH